MRPELPFIAAGGLAIVGATIDKGSLPPLSGRLIAIIALIIVASATANTKLGPLVHAIGLLVLLATIMATGNVLARKRKK